MKVLSAPSARALIRWWLPAAVVVLVGAQVAAGQSPTIVRVEEDWELVVADPDPGTDAPQASFVISPLDPPYSWFYAAFEVNHRTQPSYQPGGMQVQVWLGHWLLAHREASATALLGTPGETIRWTTAMYLSEGRLVFEVMGGTSTTWGSFGTGDLRVALPDVVANLNGYSPSVSLGNSGIGFAANRVGSAVLRQVRRTTATGQVLTDDTPRVLYQQN